MKGKPAMWLICALILLAAAVWGAGGTGEGGSTQEKRIAQVLSAIEGAGQVEVALFYAPADPSFGSSASTPTGAVVVAQGAQDLAVRLRLIRAVRTLLGLSENAVDVFMMEEKR